MHQLYDQVLKLIIKKVKGHTLDILVTPHPSCLLSGQNSINQRKKGDPSSRTVVWQLGKCQPIIKTNRIERASSPTITTTCIVFLGKHDHIHFWTQIRFHVHVHTITDYYNILTQLDTSTNIQGTIFTSKFHTWVHHLCKSGEGQF